MVSFSETMIVSLNVQISTSPSCGIGLGGEKSNEEVNSHRKYTTHGFVSGTRSSLRDASDVSKPRSIEQYDDAGLPRERIMLNEP